MNRINHTVLQIFLSLGLLLALGSTAHAQIKGWEEGSRGEEISMRDLIPKLSSDEAYTERYTFSADIDGGGEIYIDFTISNLGWGDHHGASTARVEMPGMKNYEYAEKLDEGDWAYDKKGFALQIGKSSVKGVGKDKFVLRHKGRVPFEMTFENTLPMWKPGTGKISGADKYFRLALISPRANVSGRVKIDGQWRAFKGTNSGMGDYNATTFAPFDLAHRFSRFRAFNGDVFVAWRDIELAEDYGGKSLTWIVVGYKDKIVFADASARLKESRVTNRAGGYMVPRSIQIDARSGKDRVRLVMKGERIEEKDLLEGYGAPVKMVASAVSQPFQFTLPARYQLQMTIQGATATVAGESEFSMDYMNAK